MLRHQLNTDNRIKSISNSKQEHVHMHKQLQMKDLKPYHSPVPRTSHTAWTHSTSTAVLHLCCSMCFHWFGAKHSNRRWGPNQSSSQKHIADRLHILQETDTWLLCFIISENLNTLLNDGPGTVWESLYIHIASVQIVSKLLGGILNFGSILNAFY